MEIKGILYFGKKITGIVLGMLLGILIYFFFQGNNLSNMYWYFGGVIFVITIKFILDSWIQGKVEYMENRKIEYQAKYYLQYLKNIEVLTEKDEEFLINKIQNWEDIVLYIKMKIANYNLDLLKKRGLIEEEDFKSFKTFGSEDRFDIAMILIHKNIMEKSLEE